MDSRLSTQVYETIRGRIILGEIGQGTRITEERLSKELHVSRVPLREAIPQLEIDGFITSVPRRGAVVSRWTTASVHDLFDTRLALEQAAARRAAQRVRDGADVDTLRRVQIESERQLATGDELDIADANTRFHQALVDASGNELLSSLMRATSGRMTWLFYLTRQRDASVACAEHLEITEAVLSGNDRLAESIVYSHIEAGRVPSLAAMNSILADDALDDRSAQTPRDPD